MTIVRTFRHTFQFLLTACFCIFVGYLQNSKPFFDSVSLDRAEVASATAIRQSPNDVTNLYFVEFKNDFSVPDNCGYSERTLPAIDDVLNRIGNNHFSSVG